MRDIIRQLETVRRHAWLALMAQRTAVILAWTIGGLLGVILLDFLLRFPGLFRAVVGLAGLTTLLYFLWTYVRGAMGFHPTLTQVALRVERSMPEVAGRLASSVEFAVGGVDQANELAARSVRDTQTRLDGESLDRSMRLGRTWRDLAIFAGIAALATVIVIASPASAATGLKRVLIPFSDATWPARTGVMSLMDRVLPPSGVHPLGQALPLRAMVTKGDDDQRVQARVRMRVDGRFGSWQDLVLTHQGGGVHERLIDPEAEVLEVQFRTADDQSEVQVISLVPPPAVIRATLSVTPPTYAANRVAAGEMELGPGTDERSVTETAALIGSEARLDLVLNKKLPVPTDGIERAAWLRETFSFGDELRGPSEEELSGETLAVDDQGRSVWSIRWEITGLRQLGLNLRDEHGLTNTDSIRYRIDAVEDRLPVVAVIEPETDESVLATAVVPLAAEANDDVAIGSIALEAVLVPSGAVDVASGTGPDWQSTQTFDAGTARLTDDLDLSQFPLKEGDEIRVRGVARDVYELRGQRHEAVPSAVRRLRVISELDFASQLRRQLGAVRQNAIRIEGRQSELQEDVAEDGAQPGVERAQAQIGERVAAQQETLEKLDGMIRKNRLDDPQLTELLDQAEDLLDFAGRAANRAVEAIEERQAAGPARSDRNGQGQEQGQGQEEKDSPGFDSPPEPQEEDRPIVEAQQEVRDELADLIELLDRDEDTWVVTRQLETLLEQQNRLEARTSRLQQQTIGRSREDLSEQEQTELDRITEAQMGLRDEARQTIDELRERARALEEVDPQSASGMRSAANTGEQRELDRDMENAADRTEQNQLRNATAHQQSARDTLQRMLEDIEESKRAQAEQLLRQLASLIESITRLVTVQENELTALAAAIAADQFSGRDRSMIRLNQNTQAVAGEARSTGQQARRIARTLDRAADAQGAAVVALRARPLLAADAEEAENRSLELLKEAQKLAEELQQETEEEQVRQKREELIEAYREFAERQIAIRESTLELGAQEEMDRRRLVEARRLATSQDELRTDLADLRTSTRELMDAPVFTLVHRQIDDWSIRAAESLRDGNASVDVTDRQQRVASAIGRLIAAVQESMAPPPEFAGEEGQSGGGSSQQAPPLIPPVAELRLMQGMQEEIYQSTRSVDNREDLGDGQRRQRLRELGREQRDLMDLGQEMIERLQPGGAGTPE